jgi:hypothetical protein
LRKRERNRKIEMARYYDSDPVEIWAKVALRDARARARYHDGEFALTLQDVLDLAQGVTTCPLTGVTLTFDRGRGYSHPDSASVDRIDNAKSYTRDNCHVVSHGGNIAKNRLTLDQLVQMGNWAREQQQADLERGQERFGELVSAFCDVVERFKSQADRREI